MPAVHNAKHDKEQDLDCKCIFMIDSNTSYYKILSYSIRTGLATNVTAYAMNCNVELSYFPLSDSPDAT